MRFWGAVTNTCLKLGEPRLTGKFEAGAQRPRDDGALGVEADGEE